MSAPLAFRVMGVGAWAPGAPNWQCLQAMLRGEAAAMDGAPASPAGMILPAAERRRAPDGVRLAAEVAAQATGMAGIDPATVPCVFASTQGELAITDYVCETLARSPLELSPTKFHNSVLNAPAGYWTIATGCTGASSAVTAHHRSFAAGLLEAAAFACAEGTPVLFAACDVASTGPLAEMTRTTLAFGMALLLQPDGSKGVRLNLALHRGAAEPVPAVTWPVVARDNPANADALALLSLLAGANASNLRLPLSSGLSLDMEIEP